MPRYSIDESHDPARTSWVESANGHPDFPVQNLPFGMFSDPGEQPRAGVAIGDHILDLRAASEFGLLPVAGAAALTATSLNAVMGLALEDRRALRICISRLLSDPALRRSVAQYCMPRMAVPCICHP